MRKKIPIGPLSMLNIRLILLVLIFSISRFLFYYLNKSYFPDINSSQLIKILIAGLRFDLAVIFGLNIPLILACIIPLTIRFNKLYQKICTSFFIITNSIYILFNCIDVVYFRFTLKRTTADFFTMLGKGNEYLNLLPQFIIDFWYVPLMWICFVLILFIPQTIFKLKSNNPLIINSSRKKLQTILIKTFYFFIYVAITIIFARGGLQLRPIGIVTAGQYAAAQDIPLVLNTPFTIVMTFNSNEVQDVNYFPEKKLQSIYNPCRQKLHKDEFIKSNIIIIILESFSKKYIGALNPNTKANKSCTPFLDSLIHESYVCNHAYANGRKSMEALPSILSGIPSLTNNPFITSKFSINKVNSLAGILKPLTYTSAFFHGGTNGTLGFNDYILSCRFDKYYGRNEYNNENDYDGHWGIYDEEFLKYTAKEINQFHSPFLAAIFTLSSHYPFKVPTKYENKFPIESEPIRKTIKYADYSLRKFFETASTMPWYSNTIFVITADHTYEASLPMFITKFGNYEIPIIFFKPKSNLKGVNSKIVQHIDIMPSLLDFLNYNQPYFSFGNSVFDSTSQHFSVNYLNTIYQLIQDDYILQHDGKNIKAFYDSKQDPKLLKNQRSKPLPKKEEMEIFLKAIIQTFNHRMVHNELFCK